MAAKETQVKDLQVELLNEKLKNLEAQVTKPKTTEEQFQERVARYESKQAERDELKAKIEQRKMQIWQENPRMRSDEVQLIESWERRAKEIEASNPEFAKRLRYEIKRKIKEVNEDLNR